jgi:predicted lipoprotein with Yx(FWY)xxD motif
VGEDPETHAEKDTMRRFLARAGTLITTAAVTAACTTAPAGERDPEPYGAPGSGSPKAAGAAPDSLTAALPHAPVRAADSPLGKILVDADGRALYFFEKDKDGVPGCYDECAETWRPYLTRGAPEPAEGVTSHLLGVAERSDGTTQVTYAGRPLYRYLEDPGPGEVTGSAVKRFGARWHAITPKGKRPAKRP